MTIRRHISQRQASPARSNRIMFIRPSKRWAAKIWTTTRQDTQRCVYVGALIIIMGPGTGRSRPVGEEHTLSSSYYSHDISDNYWLANYHSRSREIELKWFSPLPVDMGKWAIIVQSGPSIIYNGHLTFMATGQPALAPVYWRGRNILWRSGRAQCLSRRPIQCLFNITRWCDKNIAPCMQASNRWSRHIKGGSHFISSLLVR